MKVLVACEKSDVVGSAFRAQGHDVTSCDLEPSEGSPNHMQGDVRPLLLEPWDLVIAHPPCTYLSVARGKPSDDDDAILAALEFFADCQNANAPRVAVENPGIYRFAQAVLGIPDCRVDPYHFGDPYRKRTWWWLKGLPPLMPTQAADSSKSWVNSTNRGPGRNGAVRDKALRARFFPGMAAAMAQQWGNYQ